MKTAEQNSVEALMALRVKPQGIHSAMGPGLAFIYSS